MVELMLAQKQSISDFEKLVLPKIKEWIPNCEYTSIEEAKFFAQGVASKLLGNFDYYAGIDGIIVNHTDCWIKGCAIRVQPGTDWSTFTIRWRKFNGIKTEYAKRLAAISDDNMYPQLTIQAYVNNGHLLSCAMCSTKKLYEYIKNGYTLNYRDVYSDGGATFMVIKWSDFAKHYDLQQYHATMADLYC
jgi:hypothetical protein